MENYTTISRQALVTALLDDDKSVTVTTSNPLQQSAVDNYRKAVADAQHCDTNPRASAILAWTESTIADGIADGSIVAQVAL